MVQFPKNKILIYVSSRWKNQSNKHYHYRNIAGQCDGDSNEYTPESLLMITTWLILKTLPKSTIQKGSVSLLEWMQLRWLKRGFRLPSTALDDTPL